MMDFLKYIVGIAGIILFIFAVVNAFLKGETARQRRIGFSVLTITFWLIFYAIDYL